MSRLRFLLLSSVVLFPMIVSNRSAQADWLDDLRLGGYVIVLRHGATYSNQADTDPLNMKNVAAQRQLNDQGRAQAKMIGESMRRLKIPVSMVVTSTFQRAVETGTLLGFGEVTATSDVAEGGLVVSPDENSRRTLALRQLAGTHPPADKQPCDRHSQAEHHGCLRQGLVRCPRRRGIRVRAGRLWRLQADCPCPGKRMERAGEGVTRSA